MLISEIGEIGLIKKLTQGIFLQEEVLEGVGDDAAVIRLPGGEPGGKLLLLTKDVLVEDIHFLRDRITFWQLGMKALAVNISDIAAMGGTPRHALVAVGLPDGLRLDGVEEIYRGIRDLCRLYRVNLVGGDTVKTPGGIILSVTLVGEVAEKDLLLRSGAREGDLVAVTGSLGASAAGLGLLLQQKKPGEPWAEEVIQEHLEPPVRLREAGILAASGLVTSMIDLSDGFLKDQGEVNRASKVGVEIGLDKIPVGPAAREAARFLGEDPLDLALAGGEDYELLFTVRGDREEEFRQLAGEKMPGLVTIIGRVIPESEGIRLLDRQGNPVPVTRQGYTHF